MAAAVPYSARRIYWADQETIDQYLPNDANSAGWFDLATEGELVCAIPGRGQTLVWTTVDLWSMTWTGGEFVFSFKQEGNRCGIISMAAAVQLDNAALWMGHDRFFMFDGFVKPLPCEVSEYVYGRLNRSQSAKIWALVNSQFSEVTWFYPSGSNTECDSYVTYNYLEGHWSFGALARTCGVAQQAGALLVGPVLIASDGKIYDHETGNARTGTVFLESGPAEVADGDNVVRVQSVVPDDKTLGDVNVTIYSAFSPDDAEQTHGPYTLSKVTPIRLTARQARIRIQEVVATAWRVGVVRLGTIVGGRR